MPTEPLLLARGIEKRFPGVNALTGVDLDVRAGEVHTLMGQNGAGKSTLIKVLTGVHRRDAGTILFQGRELRPTSPGDAQRHGISTIYQEINLVPTLTVAENLFLGRAPRRWWGIDWRTIRRKGREVLARFALDIDVDQPLGSMSTAVQQLVSIARAVDIDARMLIMDEPTSSLDSHETEVLFGVMDRLKAQGLGIIFVTHFLDQVYRVSDRITVLRNGARVGTYQAAELSRLELVAHMLGHAPEEPRTTEQHGEQGKPVLRAQALGRRGLEPFDLTVHAGEIVGFAGLLGSGRTEAARLLFGADAAESGEVNGGTLRSPRHAIAQGIALTPEDRKVEGIIPDLSVRENIVLVVQRTMGVVISRAAQERVAQTFVDRLHIKTPSLEQPVGLLSGGNQQKVILARWLAARPLALILDEPTRGIDIGAKDEIEALIRELAREGMAVLFISAALEEVARLCRRILVFRDRKHVAEIQGVTVPEIMAVIAGRPASEQAPKPAADQKPSAAPGAADPGQAPEEPGGTA